MVLKKLKAWTVIHLCLNHFHQRLRNNWRREKLLCICSGWTNCIVKITETQRKDLTSICFVSDRKREQRNQRQRVNAFQFVGRLVGQSNCETNSRTYKSDIKKLAK
jgi:hypothetical protein